jgi:hypothetical protein
MPSEGSRSVGSPDTATIRGAAGMAYGDELMYELWRAPRMLVMACLATFMFSCLWAVYLFLANLPMSWNYAIQQPGVAAQEISRFVFELSKSWLPFPLLLFFFHRQLTWLRYRFGAGRRGITYEVTEVGIVNGYDKGFAITMPWALTKSLARTKRLLLLRSNWCCWWYLPCARSAPTIRSACGRTPERASLRLASRPSRRHGSRRHCEERKRRSNRDLLHRLLDCFAEPVIGRAFARPAGSQ